MFFGFWKSLKILFLVLEEKILSIKKPQQKICRLIANENSLFVGF
jgi:hypothetical protein